MHRAQHPVSSIPNGSGHAAALVHNGHPLPFALFLCAAAALLLSLLAPLAAHAVEAQEELRVVYGFDREFPPFSFEMDGKATGFDVDILKAVFHGSDAQLVMRPLTWDKVQLELSAGNVQITSGMAKTKQRLLLYNFSDHPVLPLNVQLFTKENKRVGNTTLLRGRTVSVHKGSFYQRVLEEFGGLNVKLYKSELAALKALARDEVDAFGGGDRTAYYYIRKLNLFGISAVGTPLRVTNVYFALNKDAKDALKIVNLGMRRIMENGEYDRIYRKWFVHEINTKERGQLVQAAAKASINAYAPYSKRPMGAAVLTHAGNIYTGCNVENALFSASASALNVAVHNTINNGENQIRAVAVVDGSGRVVPPTADERQTLFEFGRGVLAVIEPEKGEYQMRTIAELLPMGYSARQDETIE